MWVILAICGRAKAEECVYTHSNLGSCDVGEQTLIFKNKTNIGTCSTRRAQSSPKSLHKVDKRSTERDQENGRRVSEIRWQKRDRLFAEHDYISIFTGSKDMIAPTV